MPVIIASFSGLYGYGRVFDTGTVISTIQGSQYLNGETSYMIVANTNEFRMSTGDFTVEWFQNIEYLNTLSRIFTIGTMPLPSFAFSLSTYISSTTDVLMPFDPIFVWPSTSSSLTSITNAIDGLSSTSYRNNAKYGGGFIVRPNAGASVVTQVAFVTAANSPEADPTTFTIEGTNTPITSATMDLSFIPWTTIAANQATNCLTSRLIKSFSATFSNTAAYTAYRIRFPTIRDGATATFVQIGEVELLGSIVTTFANVWMNSSIVMNTACSSILYNSWVHFALSRSTNTTRLFQNGFQIGSTLTSTINLVNSTNSLLIGTSFDAGNSVTPILSTQTPTSISSTSLSFAGILQNTGGDFVTVRGFVWSTSPNPTISLPTRVQESGNFTAGSFSLITASLLPATLYYIRAFATNSVGTGYGVQVTFTTDSSAPIISSISVSTITQSSTLVIGQIVATGGYDVTLRGIVWDTVTDPTISLSTQRSEVGIFSQPGFFSTIAAPLSTNIAYFTRPFGSNILGVSYGASMQIQAGLYQFTSFTFTNATKQGAQGPSLANVQTAYSATSWTQTTAYLNVSTQGIQDWTVPKTGTYSIELAGAAGGFRTSTSGTARPGYGYRISGRLTLTQGQTVRIVVGQRGVGVTSSSVSGNQACGGGGASCVFTGTTLLMIAAGGNGQSWESHTVPDPDGRGTGQTVTLTLQGRGYKGATFNANGTDGGAAAALSILNGAVGGNANGAYAATGSYSTAGGFPYAGGFGGGGGTNPYEGGGGGGFQGGIPKGENQYAVSYPSQSAVSFIDSSVTNQTNIGTNTSGTLSDPTSLHGYCAVTFLS